MLMDDLIDPVEETQQQFDVGLPDQIGSTRS